MLIIVQNEANETFAPRTFSPEKSSLNARARRRRRGKRDHALAFVIYRRERVSTRPREKCIECIEEEEEEEVIVPAEGSVERSIMLKRCILKFIRSRPFLKVSSHRESIP